tara:strand:+ start:5918 stop:6271 length:354 start_codon:yes stop_codon:yes gene_type:complete
MNPDVATVREWHTARGFDDIGYHYLIKRNGQVEKGREDHVTGAHAKGYNSDSLGIALSGGKAKDNGPEFNFTRRQMKSLEALCERLTTEYPITKVIGHNEVSSKTCPNFDVKSWWYA